MLKPEDLQALVVGDVVEVPSLMKGLMDDPVRFEVIEVCDIEDRTVRKFEGTVLGIVIGRWRGESFGAAVTWSKLA